MWHRFWHEYGYCGRTARLPYWRIKRKGTSSLSEKDEDWYGKVDDNVWLQK